MSRQGDGYDNAAMESFWSTLKWELVFRRAFATRLQAQSEISEYLEVFHNPPAFSQRVKFLFSG
jgi:putative transposase